MNAEFMEEEALTGEQPVATTMKGRKPFQCLICKKRFKRAGNLNNHMEKHKTDNIQIKDWLAVRNLEFPPDKPYMCSVASCAMRFSRIDSLTRHLKVHKNDKLRHCPCCVHRIEVGSDNVTLLGDALLRHKRQNLYESLADTDSQPYACPIDSCIWRFSKPEYLTQHIKIHRGAKPFECPICLKNYTRIDRLTSHIRTHTGEKPFTCNLCGMSFTRGDIRLRHLRSHTKRECDVCADGTCEIGCTPTQPELVDVYTNQY